MNTIKSKAKKIIAPLMLILCDIIDITTRGVSVMIVITIIITFVWLILELLEKEPV